MWGFFCFNHKLKGYTMADENGAKAGDAQAAEAKATENKSKDERSGWTADQWQDYAQREADRRVTDAQKKWRDDLTAQLTAKDRDAETKIQEALSKAEQAETRAAFVERANSTGVADVKAAWALVQTDEAYRDKRGNVDFEKLKTEHPALFGVLPKARPVGNAPGDPSAAPKTLGAALRQAVTGA